MPCDYKEYPDNWFIEIRPAILKRANNCCELCFAPNGEKVVRYKNGRWFHNVGNFEIDKNYKITKIVLTIHHIFENDKMTQDLLRMLALCQRCHLKLDMWKHVKKRKENKLKNKTLFD